MDDSQILAITKNPGEAATLAWLPSSQANLAAAWGTRVLEHPLTNPRMLILCKESQEFGGELNLTLPYELPGPLAIVALESGPRYRSVPHEHVYRALQWTMLADARVDAESVTYYGVSEGPGYDRVYVERVDDTRRKRRTPLTHHVRHSATGFSWGYGGNGPAELARCLLADFLYLDCHSDDVDGPAFSEIDEIYQAFKDDVIARLPQDLRGWRIYGYEIMAWLREHPPSPVCQVHRERRRQDDGSCAACEAAGLVQRLGCVVTQYPLA